MDDIDLKLLEGRNNYRYPTAYLSDVSGLKVNREGKPPVDRPVPATSEERQRMGQNAWLTHHKDLLSSGDPNKAILGVMSVCYWGFYAGADPERRPTEGRALTRAMWVRDGIDENTICEQLEDIFTALENGDVKSAMLSVRHISQFGSTSFASKLLSAMAPELCGTHDSVVKEDLVKAGGKWAELAVAQGPIKDKTAEAYAKWCAQLVKRADEMNALGSGAGWQELGSGARNRWRALDVERGLFYSHDATVLGKLE